MRAASRPVWACSHVGLVRPLNEDGCLVGDWRSTGPIAGWRGELASDGGWVVVADGMGGHEAGDVASRVVLDVISRKIRGVETAHDVEEMLEIANQTLYEAMYNDGRPGMGTTVVGARLFADHALIFNVGDSRAYGRGPDRLVQISHDDSLGHHGTRDRIRGHTLLQSLGGTIRRGGLQPHVLRTPLPVGLLLCSDGLTDMLSDEEIVGVWRRNPTDPAERLVAAALDAGGKDNVTVVVVGSPDKPGD
jgi:serine/threonine protein phosphatase PrpC